ncbi:MAG: mucoidy inhibitor MuiA family protein [Bacteroidia bacterium]
MKHFYSLILCLGMTIPALTAGNEQPEQIVKAPVQSVIVYLEGAQLTQSKQVSLKPGRNLITFTGISSKLLSKSVQATVTGEVSIYALSDKINFLTTQEETPRVKQLRDSLRLQSEESARIVYDREAFDTEKRLLIQNEVMSGKDKGLATAELKLAADFYRTRMKEINAELFKLDRQNSALSKIITRLNQQLAELNATRSAPTAEISVLLSCTAPVTTTLEIKYMVNNAGWAPSYDLIAEDINKPIELKYRAKVFNNTDIDWNEVKLKISSADPTQSASKPQINPWYVNFNSGNYYNQNYSQQSFGLNNNAPASQPAPAYSNTLKNDMDMDGVPDYQDKKGKKAEVTYEQIQVSELSAEFDIKNPYTIPSDSKPYIIEVTSYNLPATYKYYSVPKIDRDAFMLARITGWEDLDLVEGPANVYFGGTFVGQSYIYTRSVDDTLDLSLGRDSKILVTRTKMKDFSADKLIGNNRKVTYAYEMVIKNNRKAPITINLEDQIPVSQNNDITVDAIEISHAQQDVLSGKLSWTYTIQPGEQQKVQLAYSVKYPRNKAISLQKTKMRARAKF